MAGKNAALNKNLYAVIMAGGKGTRFWPLSRETFPKQFLKIHGSRTLLQDTMHRLEGQVLHKNTLIITTSVQEQIVNWQAREISNRVQCVVEPEGKNTAPAIALAAFKLYKKNKDAIILVLPSDHAIKETDIFAQTLAEALPFAMQGRIVTFGIKPRKPETGYGYIRAGRALQGNVHNVLRFVEKPDAKTARQYLKTGTYYWNSGMFIFRAKDMIKEFRTHMPALYRKFAAIRDALNTRKEGAALKQAYAALKEQSIDYGVMEKSKNVVMIRADFTWSDLGSWTALDDVMEHDRNGNVTVGNVVQLDSSNSIFFAGKKLVAAIGLKDMVVVDTADSTLIMPKDRVQEVKEIVGMLKAQGKEEYLVQSMEERPWGYFSVLEEGPTHKIKHIYLHPKAKLSLQMHNHRSEHWIVVAGTAKVQRGDDIFFVHQNESTFIPANVKHRLENTGIIPLRIVEIQSGEYLGEDDIIRFDDIYGRKKGAVKRSSGR